MIIMHCFDFLCLGHDTDNGRKTPSTTGLSMRIKHHGAAKTNDLKMDIDLPPNTTTITETQIMRPQSKLCGNTTPLISRPEKTRLPSEAKTLAAINEQRCNGACVRI